MTNYMDVIAFFGALAVVTVISSHLSMLIQPSNSTYCFLTFDTFCGFACLSLLMGCIDSLVETVLLFRAYHRKSTLDAAICAQCIDRLKSVRTTTISGPMVEQMLKSCQSCAPAVSTNPTDPAALPESSKPDDVPAAPERLDEDAKSDSSNSTNSTNCTNSEISSTNCALPEISHSGEEKKHSDDCSDAISGASTV